MVQPGSRWSHPMVTLSYSLTKSGWDRPAPSRSLSAPAGRASQPRPPLSGPHQILPAKKQNKSDRWAKKGLPLEKKKSVSSYPALNLVYYTSGSWDCQNLLAPKKTVLKTHAYYIQLKNVSIPSMSHCWQYWVLFSAKSSQRVHSLILLTTPREVLLAPFYKKRNQGSQTATCLKPQSPEYKPESAWPQRSSNH